MNGTLEDAVIQGKAAEERSVQFACFVLLLLSDPIPSVRNEYAGAPCATNLCTASTFTLIEEQSTTGLALRVSSAGAA